MTTLSPQQKSLSVELIRRREPRLYAALIHHRNTGNKHLSFAKKPYLLPIYSDNSKDIVIMKSVQCGITEWLIIDTLSKCEKSWSVFYVLPKFDLRNTFVKNRIDKLFNMVPYYARQIRDATGSADSAAIKHYAGGSIKFSSSNTISDFLEFPADCLVVDELDRCDQDNLAFAADRLKASPHRYTRKVGNPTIEGFGISDEFKKSDQKEWVVPCEHCGSFQELDFFKNVVEEVEEGNYQLRDREWNKDVVRDIHIFCANCSKPFDRFSPGSYWRRNNPESEVSGYHISRMMEPGISIRELYKIFVDSQGNETKKQAFHNSDLGIPFQSKGAKLTDYLLSQCIADYFMPSSATDTIMGVDVGSVLHVSISKLDDGKRKKVFIGTVPSFESVDRLINLYGVGCAVVDALPETHEAKKLRDRNRGIVWLCEFHAREGGAKELKLNHEDYKVSADRTQSIDEGHADILLKNVLYPQDAASIDEGNFFEQMRAPTRVFDENSNRFVWREGTKADHYRLADTYEKMAQVISEQNGVRACSL